MCPAAVVLLAASCLPSAGTTIPGLRAPEGFEVVEFAGSDLANDIYCLTFDSHGRVLVSGRGYLRLLIDDNDDGRADRVVPFADGPADGAMGLLSEGDSLFVVGGGGLWRYRDRDGDGRADGPPEKLRPLKTGGEHDAHALRRGPDGWLYLLCGNSTGIGPAFAGPASPVRQPVAGAVVRFSPDFRTSEVVAHGFRNAYGMDFNADGELFTYDSDNERCVSLPWYEGTRFYHVLPGGHHGWQSPQRGQFFRWPPYFADVIAPLADLGRGSPTGVVCYRHAQFPARYRGGFFLADWTFGRLWFVPLTRAGSTYTAAPEVFLHATGDNGFAPTGLAVHPRTGDLYVSVGGRGTRGAVYRIRHPRGLASLDAAAVARLQPLPRTLDPRPPAGLLRELESVDLFRRRVALEALRRQLADLTPSQLLQAVRAGWDAPDRPLRLAVLPFLAALPADHWPALAREARGPWARLTMAQARVPRDRSAGLADALALARDRSLPADVRLAAVRVAQLALGDLTARTAHNTVWEGYTLYQPEPRPNGAEAAAGLADLLPTGQPDFDRELLRVLALLETGDPALPARIARRWTDASDPVDDLHALIVLARLRASWPDSMARQVADAMLALDRKLTARRATRDTNWPLRVTELHAELAHRHPELNDALLAHPDFGRPDHALFAQAPGLDRRRAAGLFLGRAAADPEYAWTPDLVRLVAALPEEQCFPVLRKLWDHGGLDETLVSILSRRPVMEERDRYVAGLRSPQPATVRACLDALDRLGGRAGGKEVLALIRCLRSLPASKDSDALRERLARHLAAATGQAGLGADVARWSAWFVAAHPELASRLEGADGIDVAAWKKRLTGINWASGDAARGQAVFQKASCAACHSGSQAVGPDLHGVAGRFSRDDLFTAMLQPNRDIPTRYRPVSVALRDGRSYVGLVIYEATDSLLLQTGPAQTVRVPADRIESRRPADVSLMPAGLLDALSDRDLADLYAHLRSLGQGKTAVSP